jgi:outer membrane lipoprotein carrier protein
VRRRKIAWWRVLAVGLTLSGAVAAQAAATATVADDASTRVDAYLATVRTLEADFVQVVRDSNGQITSRATGTLTLSRPDRFRWDYREPYLQTIVADGRKLWLYDPDLAQVTVRPLEQGLGSTPALLLSGAGKVSEAFAPGGVERRGELTWCLLKPRQRTSDFERVSLAFDAKGELAAMELLDKLGQATQIDFSRVRRNGKVADALFQFVPPKGADVIGNAAP